MQENTIGGGAVLFIKSGQVAKPLERATGRPVNTGEPEYGKN